jgi:hypothetical protein
VISSHPFPFFHMPSTSAQVYIDRPLNVCMKEKEKEFNVVEQIFRTRA